MEALLSLMFIFSAAGYLLVRGLSHRLTVRNMRRISAEAHRLDAEAHLRDAAYNRVNRRQPL